MTESYIKHSAGGTTFVGPDAVSYYAAMSVRSALKLWRDAKIKVNGSFTVRRYLDNATHYTKKPYTVRQVSQAIDDLHVWCNAMRSALPESTEEVKGS